MISFQENLKSLAKAKDPWYVAVKALADAPSGTVYADFGQLATIAFVATGDAKYLADATTKLLKRATIDPLPLGNDVREYFAELAMLYSWIRPYLSQENNLEFEKRLNRWCEFCCALGTPKYNGGWNYADSDLTIGQYLGLLLCDQIFGWKWTEREDVKKARVAIKSYCDKAEGGEWIESSAYNLGTLQILLMGAYAAGIEHFPEVELLVPQIVEWQLALLTPDFKQAVQWGDEENPREMHIHRRVNLFSMLYGITGDDRIKTARNIILGTKPFPAKLSWRALYFNPPEKPVFEFLRVSQGTGHYIYKKGSALLEVHFPERLAVHHDVMFQSNIQLWLDGEWALTHPLGYGLPAVAGDAANAPLFAGLSSMYDRGPTSAIESNSGCEITGSTSGVYYDPTYYRPPPAFVNHTRKVEYSFPGKLVVTDSFKGNKPTNTSLYRAADKLLVETSPLWQQVWHCPENPTETPTGYTWKTLGGKTVTLTAPKNTKRVVIDEKAKWGGFTTNFKSSELKWQIRFCSDEPVFEMQTVFEVK